MLNIMIEQFLARLRQTPAGREIEQQDAAAVQANRKAQSVRRTELLAKIEAAAVARNKVQAAQADRIAKAAAALAAALADPAIGPAQSLLASLEAGLSRVESDLRQTRPPALDAFLRECDEQAAQLYPGRFTAVETVPWLGMSRPVGSNYAALAGWADRLAKRIRPAVDALALECLTPEALEARLEALREELGDLPTAADVVAPLGADRGAQAGVAAFHGAWSRPDPTVAA